MKIALQCENLLLQSTLEYFLKDYLCNESMCDFILSDISRPSSKPLCLLGGKDCDISEIFTPQSLMQSLDDFYISHCLQAAKDSSLEYEVSQLMHEYTKKLCALLLRKTKKS